MMTRLSIYSVIIISTLIKYGNNSILIILLMYFQQQDKHAIHENFRDTNMQLLPRAVLCPQC